MRKMTGFLSLLVLLAVSAFAEIKSIDIKIFGMD
jgi:hypothetical protein